MAQAIAEWTIWTDAGEPVENVDMEGKPPYWVVHRTKIRLDGRERPALLAPVA